MSINRGGTPLIWTHYLLKQVRMREKEEARWRGEIVVIVFGVLTILVGIVLGDEIYTKEVARFSPLWFPSIKSLCSFVLLCLSFFQ